jgi:hypothetical protein
VRDSAEVRSLLRLLRSGWEVSLERHDLLPPRLQVLCRPRRLLAVVSSRGAGWVLVRRGRPDCMAMGRIGWGLAAFQAWVGPLEVLAVHRPVEEEEELPARRQVETQE